MAENAEKTAEWVGRCILPCEGDVRLWLRRASVAPHDIDDIVQEAYSVLAGIGDFDRIANPRAYFLEVAKNILRRQLRRSRIVRIDTVAEIDTLGIMDDRPSQETAAIAREEMRRLQQLIEALPARCRRIFEMRKIEGLSQKEIARSLHVTENTVETQVGRGMKLIMQAWAGGGGLRVDKDHVDRGPAGKRKSH